MTITPSIVAALLAEVYPPSSDLSDVTREDRKLAQAFISKLRAAEEDQMFFDEDEELDVDEEDDGKDSDGTWDGEDSGDDVNDNHLHNFSNGSAATVEEMDSALSFYRSTKKKSRSLAVMNHHHRFIKTVNDLNRLRDYEKSKTIKRTRLAGLKELASRLWEKVREGIEAGHSLHDLDLRQMAMSINHARNLVAGFKASPSWVARWKKLHRIRSRRITTFVSAANFVNSDKIKQDANDFVKKIRLEMEKKPLEHFANADQSGFLKEMHPSRSLSHIGSKKVIRVVQSKASITHSYTVMPVIFADGRLGDLLFVVLQEVGGKFPQKGHFMAKNLFVSCGTSHIMTKSHMKLFFNHCLFSSSTPNEIHLLIDSWTSFKDKDAIQSSIPSKKKLVTYNIPGGATSLIQPEDVYYFRPFKGLVRRITSHAYLFEDGFIVYQRDNILKVASVSHFIMGAARFRKMIQYAWFAAGYTDSHPGQFDTPVQYCFPSDIHTTHCHDRHCSSCSFIVCPRCENRFCFTHFVVKVHTC